LNLQYYQQIQEQIQKLKDRLQGNQGHLNRQKIEVLLVDLKRDLQRAEASYLQALKDNQFQLINAGNLMLIQRYQNFIGLSREEVKALQKNLKEIQLNEFIGKTTKIRSKTVNIEQMIKNISNVVQRDLRAEIIGGYAEGLHPNEIAQVIGKGSSRKIKRHIKTVTRAVIDKTRQQTNLEVFEKNDVKWIDFVTADDDRVETVCQKYSQDAKANHYSPEDFPKHMVPQVHFGCRCVLVPRFSKKTKK